MVNGKWKKRKDKYLESKTKKLPGKKIDFRNERNVSRIYLETLCKSMINQLKKLLIAN